MLIACMSTHLSLPARSVLIMTSVANLPIVIGSHPILYTHQLIPIVIVPAAVTVLGSILEVATMVME